jgi:hypothetical protein
MKDKDKNRDQELDGLLNAFRKEDPGLEDFERWSKAVNNELSTDRFEIKRRMPRLMEWAIAASVGFFIAIALEKTSVSDPGFKNSEIKNYSADYSGIDATEMKLVAIHE